MEHTGKTQTCVCVRSVGSFWKAPSNYAVMPIVSWEYHHKSSSSLLLSVLLFMRAWKPGKWRCNTFRFLLEKGFVICVDGENSLIHLSRKMRIESCASTKSTKRHPRIALPIKKVRKKEIWWISAGILHSSQCSSGHQHCQVLSAPCWMPSICQSYSEGAPSFHGWPFSNNYWSVILPSSLAWPVWCWLVKSVMSYYSVVLLDEAT